MDSKLRLILRVSKSAAIEGKSPQTTNLLNWRILIDWRAERSNIRFGQNTPEDAMAVLTDHIPAHARQMLSADARTHAKPGAPRIARKCRPLPSQRVSRTMPYQICLRLAGAWIGALAVVLAVVWVLRWMV
jgi:hypothetical protein